MALRAKDGPEQQLQAVVFRSYLFYHLIGAGE